MAIDPGYLRANPAIKERFEGIKSKSHSYLAHEYFNRDWQPMYVADMARWLEPAKASLAVSAHPLDSVDAINLTAEQQALLNGLSDPIMRETVRDYCVNQHFRRDLWVKGAHRLTPMEKVDALRSQRFLLTMPRDGVPMSANGALGSGDLSETIYVPILDLMSDNKIRSLGEIEIALENKIPFNQLLQAAMVLTGMGAFALPLERATISKAKKKTERLNAHLMERARSSNDIAYLASPVTGGGVQVGRFLQLFCLALKSGHKSPESWANFAFQLLQLQGQQLIKEGKTLETDDDNRAELLRQAQEFATRQLPILKALEIV